MILKLKSFIQTGTFIAYKKFLTTMSLLTSLMKQYILLIYITRYPTLEIKYSKILSGESTLLVKTKEYTMVYISDKFQGVWMTKFFRMSVFYRALRSIRMHEISSLNISRKLHVDTFCSLIWYNNFFLHRKEYRHQWFSICQLSIDKCIELSRKLQIENVYLYGSMLALEVNSGKEKSWKWF